MAGCTSTSQSFVALARGTKRLQLSDPLMQCLAPRLARSYATHSEAPIEQVTGKLKQPKGIVTDSHLAAGTIHSPFHTRVLTTTYKWPSMQPSSYASFASQHLNAPLRKDILHRAVVFEADAARQGTGSTKYRDQVRGSGKKIRPQKGSGRARLSDRKSPSIRGGGVAHGPHFRDFSTDLPAKVYDLAYRTALSYRYKKGELVITDGPIVRKAEQTARWFNNFFEAHKWGRGNGRTMVVVKEQGSETQGTIEVIEQIGEHAEIRTFDDVTVRDLLSCGRVLIEARALKELLTAKSQHIKHETGGQPVSIPLTQLQRTI